MFPKQNAKLDILGFIRLPKFSEKNKQRVEKLQDPSTHGVMTDNGGGRSIPE